MKRTLLIGFVIMLIFVTTATAQENKAREGISDWGERIHLTGTLEGDFNWAKYRDITDKGSDSTSDLFISTVELGMEVEFTDRVTGTLLLLQEDIGTEDETDFAADEAMITLKGPAYLVFGKRAQPFGVFENHLVADPMTQDAYETNRVGVTVGITGPMESDISLTVYKGEEQMNHLFESDLFDADGISRYGEWSDDVGSFIISASLSPMEDRLTLFGAYLSEPGNRRNETLNAGLSLAINGVRIDGEYMKALKREEYQGVNGEFKESVISLTAAYEFVVREREEIGGALFAARKAHVVSEPLEVAVRYEYFDDDGMADALLTWAVEDRYGIGGRYAFYSDEESGLSAYAGIEYRHTDYRLHSSLKDKVSDKNDELLMRMGISF